MSIYLYIRKSYKRLWGSEYWVSYFNFYFRQLIILNKDKRLNIYPFGEFTNSRGSYVFMSYSSRITTYKVGGCSTVDNEYPCRKIVVQRYLSYEYKMFYLPPFFGFYQSQSRDGDSLPEVKREKSVVYCFIGGLSTRFTTETSIQRTTHPSSALPRCCNKRLQ